MQVDELDVIGWLRTDLVQAADRDDPLAPGQDGVDDSPILVHCVDAAPVVQALLRSGFHTTLQVGVEIPGTTVRRDA